MLKRSVLRAATAPADVTAVAATTTTTSAAASAPRQPRLLPYALRRASACEMLYGGARVQHLVQPAFPLHKIHSEHLPSPSLDAERHDLALEMQLPRSLDPYNNINMNIQRQVGADVNDPDVAPQQQHGSSSSSRDGFDMGAFYSDVHHPERHHTSSLPYSQHDTNNVMAMRLFPVNIGLRARTEAVRIRTEDCLQRLRDAKLCAMVHQPTEYPLPLSRRSQYAAHGTAAAATAAAGEEEENARSTAHLRGAAAHPPPSQLSIFTRPADRADQPAAPVRHRFPLHPFAQAAAPAAHAARGASAQTSARAWMPLQMLKPMGHNWSPAGRSSGIRGPHMQLMQERLDQKGFGWKRKSRSLWQQDVDTAGFRPHRYF